MDVSLAVPVQCLSVTLVHTLVVFLGDARYGCMGSVELRNAPGGFEVWSDGPSLHVAPMAPVANLRYRAAGDHQRFACPECGNDIMLRMSPMGDVEALVRLPGLHVVLPCSCICVCRRPI